MNEIYWITRLGALNDFFGVCALLFALLLLGAGIWFGLVSSDSDWDEKAKEKSKKMFIKTIILFLIAMLGLTFTPTKKDCLAIYGLGGTIDYIKSNDKAKKLPDKVIDALDMYLEEKSKDGR